MSIIFIYLSALSAPTPERTAFTDLKGAAEDKSDIPKLIDMKIPPPAKIVLEERVTPPHSNYRQTGDCFTVAMRRAISTGRRRDIRNIIFF